MILSDFNVYDPPIKNRELIYHYCSVQTFTNIIKNNTVRLYDLETMSDYSELALSKSGICDKIQSLYENKPFHFSYDLNGTKNNNMNTFLSLTNFGSILKRGKTISCAFCMSKEQDSLSQWRLYADNGKGVCLGFNKKQMKKFIANDKCYDLTPVKYIDDFNLLEERFAAEILQKLKNLYESNSITELMDYRTKMLDDIWHKAYQYKLKDYKLEQEVRLVYQKSTKIINASANLKDIQEAIDKSVDFDVGNSKIRLFKSVDLNKLALSSITLGPQNNIKRNNLQLFLAKYLTTDIQLYKSRIPFRDIT